MVAADHRDNTPQQRNESLSRPDGRHSTTSAARN
jgi:hypothetical protein